MSTGSRSTGASRGRRVATGVVGALAVVAILTASIAMTVRLVVLSPDTLTAVIVPVGANPQVPSALATKAASGVVTALDVEGRAGRLIGGPLGRLLAPSIARAVEARLGDAIEGALRADAFASRWEQIARAMAVGTIAVLRGDSEAVTTSDGVIYVNLLPALRGTLGALQEQGLIDPSIRLPDLGDPSAPARQVIDRLASALGVSLSPDFGQVAIVQTSALARAQGIIAALDIGSLLLLVAAAALLGAAVALADDRRSVVIGVGVGAGILVALMPPLLRAAEGVTASAIAVPGMEAVVGLLVAAVVDEASWHLRAASAGCLAVAFAVLSVGTLTGAVRLPVMSLALAAAALAFAAGWTLLGPDAALVAVALVIGAAWPLTRSSPVPPAA